MCFVAAAALCSVVVTVVTGRFVQILWPSVEV